ncbi:MAG: hypothetical protein IJY46_07770 [Lentisphaeria bacterium]|nr:hypothetical protein [Lentisphaeria bacterium]
MPLYASINSFNAGELSPKMVGRTDVSQYHKGCSKLENFMVTPYGAAERRPGTVFVAFAKQSGHVRLIRFVFSSTVSYVCEFGDRYIRFFRSAAPVLDAEGAVVEIASPYLAQELADIQFVQSADVMTIVHPSRPVMELKRIAENSFTLTEKEFAFPPCLEPNLDDKATITPSAVSSSNGSWITLTASKDTFSAGNEGGYFQLIHTRKENEIAVDFKADGVTDALEVFGYWSFTTHGTWSGTVTIQRSFDGGNTWSDFRTYSSAKDVNISTDGTEEEENVLYRLRMEDYAASSTGTLKLCRCLLVNPDYSVTGVVRIGRVDSPTVAQGTVVKKLGGITPTSEWNEGAWSSRRGFPRSIAFYEERMIFGGSESRPQTVWGSKTNNWDNFLIGDKDDDALDFTIAADTVNTINWMVQHDALIIGTMDSEWTLSASDTSSALTPSNFRIRRQSVYGSAKVQAQMVGETVLFVQRGSRKVREFVFQWEKDGYAAPDMTILAEHITASGIIATALQQLPDSILWCVLSDGSLAALTYEREQEVIGWQKHVTSGKFISCAVVPNGDEDLIYFAVDRGGKICIEVMAGRNQSADPVKQIYTDCSKVFTFEERARKLTGLEHLEGLTVQILADGSVHPERTVKDGSVTLDYPVKCCVAGLGFVSTLSPMPMELDTQSGSTMLRVKGISELRLRVYSSVGGKVACGNGSPQTIISRDILEDNFDSFISQKTEMVKILTVSGFGESTSITVTQADPLPFNLSVLTAIYQIGE